MPKRHIPAILSLALLAACAAPAPPPLPEIAPAPLAEAARMPPPAAQAMAPPATGPDLPAFFDCLRATGITVVSAHRGGPGPGLPENAIETLAATGTELAGVPVLFEVDLRRTADGTIVLLHDETLARTTTGDGEVAAMAFADLATLRLRDRNGRATPYRIPSLAEALAWAEDADAVLQLDVKRGTPWPDIAAVVQAAGAERRVIVITYEIADAVTAHRLLPEAMLSVTIRSLEDLAALEAAGIPRNRILAWTGTRDPRPELYRALADAGVEVIFGTLGRADSWDMRIAAMDSDLQYLALADQGVQMIATDRPLNAARGLAEEAVYDEHARACTAVRDGDETPRTSWR